MTDPITHTRKVNVYQYDNLQGKYRRKTFPSDVVNITSNSGTTGAAGNFVLTSLTLTATKELFGYAWGFSSSDNNIRFAVTVDNSTVLVSKATGTDSLIQQFATERDSPLFKATASSVIRLIAVNNAATSTLDGYIVGERISVFADLEP